MRKENIRSFIRVALVATALVYAGGGYLGVGVQVVAIVVFLTAYREEGAAWLRERLSRGEVNPQTEKGRSETAFHEAGHAVVGWVLPGARKPRFASIIQTEDENGRVDCDDRSGDPQDLEAALDELASWYAGIVAEREYGMRHNAGSHEDLEQATALARRMVCEWGFSGKFPRRRYDPDSGLLTEKILEGLNAEIDRFLELGEQRAVKTVKEHRDEIGRVAALLLQYGTLNAAKLRDAIERRPQ